MLYHINLELRNPSLEDVNKIAKYCIGSSIVGKYIVMATNVKHKYGDYYIMTLIVNMPRKIVETIQDIKLRSFLLDGTKIGQVKLISIDKKDKKAMVQIVVI